MLTSFTWLSLSDFSILKQIIFPPFPYWLNPLERHQSRHSKLKLCSISFGIISHGRFVYFLSFIYLFNHRIISMWSHKYLDYNPILLYFIFQLFHLCLLLSYFTLLENFCYNVNILKINIIIFSNMFLWFVWFYIILKTFYPILSSLK